MIQNSKFKIQNFAKSGFTLMELLVVVAIIGIMSAVALVSLGNSRVDRDVKSEAEIVAATIREAQNLSLTGKNAGNSCTINPKQNVFHYGENSGGTANASSYAISGCNTRDYSLKNGVSFNTATAGSFSFAIPGGEVTVAAPATLPVAVVLNKGSKFQTVCVHKSGRVEILEGNVSCP